jgi:hypothetical protein
VAQVCSQAAAVVESGVAEVVDDKPTVLDPTPMLGAVTVDILATRRPQCLCATSYHSCPWLTSRGLQRRTLRGTVDLDTIGGGQVLLTEKKLDGECKLDGIFPVIVVDEL